MVVRRQIAYRIRVRRIAGQKIGLAAAAAEVAAFSGQLRQGSFIQASPRK
jgi:hypothetical protein